MKAIKYFACFLFLALTSRIYSQIPDTIWTKTFGGSLADVGNSVKQTNDGGFIVAGTTSSFGAGGQDIYLIKTDENGDSLWTKTFGGTGNDRAANVVQTNDNGYAVFGTTNSYGNNYDFILLKVDSVGNSEWHKTFDGGLTEYAFDGLQTKDNGYVIFGTRNYPSDQGWLIKTDSSGNEVWSKLLDGYNYASFYGYSVIQTIDSGYVACGHTHFWTPWADYRWSILYKYSSAGEQLLFKYYNFTSHEVPFVVRETFDGNLILGGMTLSSYDFESRLLKVTPEGNTIWIKEIIGNQTDAYLNSLEQDVDNGFIFSIIPSGNPTNPDFELIKCDVNGDLVWKKRIGGPQYDFARSVYLTNDSGYVVVGETKSFGAGDNDVWLMKFRYPPIVNVPINFFPTVDTAWVFGGCTGPDIVTHNLVSTPLRDSITIEPGPSSYFFFYDSLGNQIIIDKYYFIVEDSLNQYDYELWFHPKSWPPFDPILIPFDSIFYFQQNSFDIKLVVKQNGIAIDSLSQIFRADWGLSVDGEEKIPNTFSLSQNYPNPFNPSTKIKFEIPAVGTRDRVSVQLKVYDVLGNEIATLVNEEKQPGSYEVEFSLNSDEGRNLSSGIYFYQLKVVGSETSSGQAFIETKKMVLIK